MGSDSRHRHNQVRVQLITQAYKEPAIPQHNTAEEVTSRLSLPIIPFVPIPRKTTAMGSAFSSNAKGLSLRRIASAAAIVCVALLLVIAGGVATLHLRENTPPVRGGVLVQDRGTTMRRVPRKMLLAEAVEPTTKAPSRKIHRASKRRPSFPRGVAHDTTDLEMEPSLAGDPEHRKKQQAAATETTPAKLNKSLLAVPVGIKNKAVVDKLVSKFPAGDFAVMLFHYDGAVEQWGDLEWSRRAVHVAAPGQTKWWFAKRFLHPDVVAEYDYVSVWDEDVEVDAFDPARYLAARREGLEVSQPALDRCSEIHHTITTRAGAGAAGRRARPRAGRALR